MKRTAILMGLASMLGGLAEAGPTGALRVEARAGGGPHRVGQAIAIRVEVEGATAPPNIEPPRLADADVRAVPGTPGPSGAGFLVIARRAGTLEVPPFRVRSGDRVGASRPTRLTVVNVPPAGRTSSFLGGVGSFEVRSEATLTTVRPGQSLDFLIRITGPAAWGSVRAPDLSGWTSLATGFRVESLPGVLVGSALPVRTFGYRLRPSRAGRLVLPPVAVSAFDPSSGRYATRYTHGVPIRVEEPPRFDPSRLDYGPGRLLDGASLLSHRWATVLGGVVAAGLTFGAGWLIARRIRNPGPTGPRRLARELIAGLDRDGDGAEAGRRVTEALATFLHRLDGRMPGALTPPEARDGFERLTLDRDLARRAGSLVELCDRARYGGSQANAEELMELGKEVLRGTAEVMTRTRTRWSKAGGGPREAVGTAKQD